jgi:Ser-tRNA(Ala) deacylase AlaX
LNKVTELLYLQDFDVLTCRAKVESVKKTDDDKADVILDQTCFYPRGGGQDWDMGAISNDETIFDVQEVRLDENGMVHHIGVYKSGELHLGDEVTCTVDTERRSINTRLHSAGHIVDLAVDRLKLPWIPVRGGHYPHMSFVEYEGEVDPEQADTIHQQIEGIANDVINKGSQSEIRFMPVSDMHTVCRHVPTNIPTNKPARVVVYNGDFGVPCGGTYVSNVHNIGHVTITKVKTKKGLTKVSYSVEGIN